MGKKGQTGAFDFVEMKLADAFFSLYPRWDISYWQIRLRMFRSLHINFDKNGSGFLNTYVKIDTVCSLRLHSGSSMFELIIPMSDLISSWMAAAVLIYMAVVLGEKGG